VVNRVESGLFGGMSKMSKQDSSRRGNAMTNNESRKSWQQKVFIILSVLLIISWIAALIITL
jgi:hypothetical protein